MRPFLSSVTVSLADANTSQGTIWRGYFNEVDRPVLTGIDDPSIHFEPEDIGRDDAALVCSHYFFNRRPDELSAKSAAEVSVMVDYLEAAIRKSAGRDPNFRFPPGHKANVDSMRLYDLPLRIFHRPLIFYTTTILLAQIANWALAIRGMRHYGQREPFWPWLWMRGRHPHGLHGFTEEEKAVAKKVAHLICRCCDTMLTQLRSAPVLVLSRPQGPKELCAIHLLPWNVRVVGCPCWE